MCSAVVSGLLNNIKNYEGPHLGFFEGEFYYVAVSGLELSQAGLKLAVILLPLLPKC